MIYLDSNYIVRCYLREKGSEEVLQLVQNSTGLSCSLHGKLEVISTFHRHYREKKITSASFQKVTHLFLEDEVKGVWNFFPLNLSLIQNACNAVLSLPPSVFCRSADALHLVSASEHGFKKIYSHDRHLLDSAPYFGLEGVDILN